MSVIEEHSGKIAGQRGYIGAVGCYISKGGAHGETRSQ